MASVREQRNILRQLANHRVYPLSEDTLGHLGDKALRNNMRFTQRSDGSFDARVVPVPRYKAIPKVDLSEIGGIVTPEERERLTRGLTVFKRERETGAQCEVITQPSYSAYVDKIPKAQKKARPEDVRWDTPTGGHYLYYLVNALKEAGNEDLIIKVRNISGTRHMDAVALDDLPQVADFVREGGMHRFHGQDGYYTPAEIDYTDNQFLELTQAIASTMPEPIS